ncbi:MAG: hypothetical protein K0R18_772 [Bacillales bacterium]|jgi:uncharacterized membrane protein YqiK|nr:hypothetical protein [Bacillales bacterium]
MFNLKQLKEVKRGEFRMVVSTTVVTIIVSIIGGLLGLFVLIKLIGFIRISPDDVGIVEKWWSPKGSVQADGLIAMNGEAGFQPAVLRAGVHLRTPLLYKVTKVKLVTIPQGQIGYVFARSGSQLENGQALGKSVDSKSFQDLRTFFDNGGQKGPQRQLLREGTFAINLSQFIIITLDKVHQISTTKDEYAQVESMRNDLSKIGGFYPVVVGAGSAYGAPNSMAIDTIGIVTVNDGPTPDNAAIIAPVVGNDVNDENYHNNFQDPEKFLLAGGRKGKQLQVLTDGIYFINRLFANVLIENKTTIDIGNVGVVVSYFGERGTDVSGTEYTHGELVEQGSRGIWRDALPPGKYPFNTYAGLIKVVPTTNVILKWISGQSGAHKLDDALREISLITKDAFEPNLPLTVVFNIDYRKASSVIQRFGDIKLLIEQSIDPMVAGYFKNIGQTKTLIELVQDRSEIQRVSSYEMKEKFKTYDLELQEVLIGTPAASANDQRIEKILAQLRDREVAKEEILTNEAKQMSAQKQKELNEAQALAEMQAKLTQSSVEISIADNDGKAKLKLAEQEALKIQKLSEADKIKKHNEADAEKYTRIASAEAAAEQTKLSADADSHKLEVMGRAQADNIKVVADAESERETKLGVAKGNAAQALVQAYGGPELQVYKCVMEAFADAVKANGHPLVPQTVIGASDGKNVNAIEGILSIALAQMAKSGTLPEFLNNTDKENTSNRFENS